MAQKHLLTIVTVFILLTLAPTALSMIELKNIKDAYNLGETITPEVSITLTNATRVNGFEKAEILCSNNYTNIFSATPANLAEGQSTHKYLPSLTVFPQLIGECSIRIFTEAADKTVVEEKLSDSFKVVDTLIPEIDKTDLEYSPSSMLTIKGSLYNARKEPVNGLMKATLRGETSSYVISTSTFGFSLKIPSDIKSGTNEVSLYFEDGKGNTATDKLSLNIVPTPSTISIKMASNNYLPYEQLKAEINVVDQANDIISKDLSLKIMKDKKVVYSGNHSGNFNYSIDNKLAPGDYRLIVTYDKLSEEVAFKISSLQQISSKLEGSELTITNTGNIKYSNTTLTTLVKDDKNTVVQKKVSLSPGEELKFDLSREADDGNYSVILPSGEQIDNVYLKDNRNIIKRAANGISSITGNAIRSTTGAGKWMSLLIIFLVAVIGIAVFIYFGGMSRIRSMGKKKEE